MQAIDRTAPILPIMPTTDCRSCRWTGAPALDRVRDAGDPPAELVGKHWYPDRRLVSRMRGAWDDLGPAVGLFSQIWAVYWRRVLNPEVLNSQRLRDQR